ncbi:MAG: Methionine aminopeptidase [Candidatus Anoxychlamydiales bacterium]|nr:Methionine aminopeptidase [Candidatus Anoxychlamydiales bacterium]NGX41478.1 Methionine aminopeptidase [Candidatus Anoxychlamydiales bacterium]HEU64624.1 methionyl aminopeptidase [Chlamydiota bacterium]
MISRNDPCWCGSNKKFKKCHYPQLKSNSDLPKTYLKDYGIIIKNKKQVEGIKRSCKIAAKILDKLCSRAKAGVTTLELDDFANELHKKYGVIPAPLNYGSPPFPKSICTSLNDVVCHGIPDKTKLKDGDILNIDVTCILDGYYGDTSRMVMIGDVTEEKKRVVETSYQCLMDSIKILTPGIKIFEIANVIEKIAKEKDCSVVNQFVGHGVGVGFHEPPQIPHSYNNIQIPLVPGMTFTIEPMINAGLRECAIDSGDKWTAKTIDSKPSAQFEHTILITENSHEILTAL